MPKTFYGYYDGEHIVTFEDLSKILTPGQLVSVTPLEFDDESLKGKTRDELLDELAKSYGTLTLEQQGYIDAYVEYLVKQNEESTE